MDIHPINPEKTLLISGDIDDWDLVRQHGVDTIIDLDGTIDSDVPEVANEILYIYFPFIDDALPDERKLTGLGQDESGHGRAEGCGAPAEHPAGRAL